MKFANGPKIRLQLQIKDDEVKTSRLFLSETFCCVGANSTLLDWIEKYLSGKPPRLNLEFGTSFQTKVALALQQVPFGKTVSYSELGELVGSLSGARAVGNTMNKNPFPLLIPCHRVIAKNGGIGGFALDLEVKRRLLEFEARFTPASRD